LAQQHHIYDIKESVAYLLDVFKYNSISLKYKVKYKQQQEVKVI